MLRQSARPRQGAPNKPTSRSGSLQSYISGCRRIIEKPALASSFLVDKVKAANPTYVPSARLSLHAFADGFVHLIGPRFFSHLLIIAMAAVIAAASGITTSRLTRASTLNPWQFEPFATRSFSQAKDFLGKPALPFTIKPKRAREGILTYEVAPGDTVTTIAERFEITAETVVAANKLDDADSLALGDKLVILPVSGILHIVRDGDTVEAVAAKYQVEPEAITDSEYNGLNEPFLLFVDQKIIVLGGKMPEVKRIVPVARAERPVEAPAASAPVRGGGRFIWPTSGQITQGFYGYHPGLDIGTAWGTPIYAAESGVVVSVEHLSYGYGWNLIVDHGDGFTTRYSHASKFLVGQGQRVSRGQPIAQVGSTGYSTGPHLDFRIYLNGVAQNPLRYLP